MVLGCIINVVVVVVVIDVTTVIKTERSKVADLALINLNPPHFVFLLFLPKANFAKTFDSLLGLLWILNSLERDERNKISQEKNQHWNSEWC